MGGRQQFGNQRCTPAVTTPIRATAALKYAVTPLAAVALTLALSSCGSDDSVDGQRYCVDGTNQVVDDDNCSDSYHGGNGAIFFFADSSRTGVPKGSRLNESEIIGGNSGRVASNDLKARESAGIPKGNGGVGKTTISRGGLGANSGAKAGSTGG